jgi:hypothetical protein
MANRIQLSSKINPGFHQITTSLVPFHFLQFQTEPGGWSHSNPPNKFKQKMSNAIDKLNALLESQLEMQSSTVLANAIAKTQSKEYSNLFIGN